MLLECLRCVLILRQVRLRELIVILGAQLLSSAHQLLLRLNLGLVVNLGLELANTTWHVLVSVAKALSCGIEACNSRMLGSKLARNVNWYSIVLAFLVDATCF